MTVENMTCTMYTHHAYRFHQTTLLQCSFTYKTSSLSEYSAVILKLNTRVRTLTIVFLCVVHLPANEALAEVFPFFQSVDSTPSSSQYTMHIM